MNPKDGGITNTMVSCYIGSKQAYSRIGMILMSDIIMESDDFKSIMDSMELLYKEYNHNTKLWSIVAISDWFYWVHRESKIPEYILVCHKVIEYGFDTNVGHGLQILNNKVIYGVQLVDGKNAKLLPDDVKDEILNVLRGGE